MQHIQMALRDANIRQALYKAARKNASENFTCFYPGCSCKAIGSHALQKSGVLDNIAEEKSPGKKFFMEYMPVDLFSPARFLPVQLLTNKLVFYGFCDNTCKNHDYEVFREIENPSSDFKQYRHQLLSSYRGLCNDIYQIKWMLYYQNSVINDRFLTKNNKELTLPARNKMQLGLNEASYYKHVMEQELFAGNNTQSFIFHRFELPKIDVAACHVFAPARVPASMNYAQLKAVDILSPTFVPNSQPFFINLIPKQDHLVFIIGHSIIKGKVQSLKIEDIDVSDLGKLDNGQVFKLMSDILVRRIDTWALSMSLYDRLVFQDKIVAYLKIRADYADPVGNPLWRRPVPFNLFEGIV